MACTLIPVVLNVKVIYNQRQRLAVIVGSILQKKFYPDKLYRSAIASRQPDIISISTLYSLNQE